MVPMEHVSASLSASDPEMMDRIGAIASRLVDSCPREIGDAGRRKEALLERALMYAAQAEQQIACQAERIEYLQSLSFTDELTGLLNRRGFLDQLRRSLADARRFGHTGVLLYFDLDNLKAINDAHGHGAGDAVLGHVGRLAEGSVREIDAVARLGGDEFAILLARTRWDDGAKRARTLEWSLGSRPCRYGGGDIFVEVSMGIEAYGPGDDAEELIRRADMAMYYVKRSKKGTLGRIAAE